MMSYSHTKKRKLIKNLKKKKDANWLKYFRELFPEKEKKAIGGLKHENKNL